MKLTKNALLAQWSAKHEYITNEISQCKHKLELLDKRQKDLMTDLRFAEIYFVASFLLGLFLLYMSKQIFSAFLYFYLPNNYAEQMCLNWLLQKYSMQLQTLQKINEQIKTAPETDYENLSKAISSLCAYERVKSTQYK